MDVLMDTLSTEAIELKRHLWEIGGCKLNLGEQNVVFPIITYFLTYTSKSQNIAPDVNIKLFC